MNQKYLFGQKVDAPKKNTKAPYTFRVEDGMLYCQCGIAGGEEEYNKIYKAILFVISAWNIDIDVSEASGKRLLRIGNIVNHPAQDLIIADITNAITDDLEDI